jgi:hypothetical protein
MHSAKIITIPTSQDQPAYCRHHRGHEHAGGNVVNPRVEFKKTNAHSGGFPSNSYHVSVTPSQACSVHVTDKDQHGFTVTLTSLDAQPLAEGKFSCLVIA